MLWNVRLALESAIDLARKDGMKITEEDLAHMLPTMTDHVNYVGSFDVDLERQPPFRLAV